MSVDPGRTVHYRGCIELCPVEGVSDPFDRVRRAVRQWIEGVVARHTHSEEPSRDFAKAWFCSGGDLRLTRGVLVKTAALTDGTTSVQPTAWSTRLEHPCSDFDHRFWRTDVGIERISGARLGVSIATYHWLQPGYYGPDPSPPEPSAPSLARTLIRGKAWTASAGSEPLTDHPNVVKVGRANEFLARISDHDRACPVVYCSSRTVEGEAWVEPARLAQRLLGMATVYAAESSNVDDELNYLAPKVYRCEKGTVRVYEVGLDLRNKEASARHRYFPPHRIAQEGAAAIEDQIARGTARRFNIVLSTRVVSVDDVHERRTRDRVRRLREEVSSRTPAERAQELEALALQSDELFREQKERADDLAKRCEVLEDEIEALGDKIRWLEYDRGAQKAQLDATTDEVIQLRSSSEAFGKLARLPRNALEVLQTIASIHSSRLLVLPEAEASAAQSEFDPAKTWECLWAMATVLHGLYFVRGTGADIAAEFERLTNFELALTERGSTKQDKKLAAVRMRMLDKERIDITPHVKIGTKAANLLRVHFFAHHDRRLLVIGHCGGHLDTAGTRRQH